MPRTPLASGHVQNMWDQKFWSCITGTVASFKLSDAKKDIYVYAHQSNFEKQQRIIHACTNTMVPGYTHHLARRAAEKRQK